MLPHQVCKPQMQEAFRKAQFFNSKELPVSLSRHTEVLRVHCGSEGTSGSRQDWEQTPLFRGTGEGASNRTPNHTAYTLEMPCTL